MKSERGFKSDEAGAAGGKMEANRVISDRVASTVGATTATLAGLARGNFMPTMSAEEVAAREMIRHNKDEPFFLAVRTWSELISKDAFTR